MKTHLPRLLAPVAPVALAVGLCALPARLDAATVIAPLELSLYVYQNYADGVPTTMGNQANSASFSAGELDEASNNRIERGILTFSLPAIPPGENLVSATLKLYVRLSATDGNASVYHSQTNGQLSGTNDHFSDTSYSSFVGYIATPATGGTDSSPKLATLDVTSWVLSDYALDPGSKRTSFRIQIDDLVFNENNVNNRYSFFGKTAANPDYVPVLELTFASAAIPEPDTAAALVGTVGLGFAACARRRPRP